MTGTTRLWTLMQTLRGTRQCHRVSSGEHVQDGPSDGNETETRKVHAELAERLCVGNGAMGEGREREKVPLAPCTSAPSDLLSTCLHRFCQ